LGVFGNPAGSLTFFKEYDMNKKTKKSRGTGSAVSLAARNLHILALLLVLAGARGYAQENLPLVNTVTLSLEGADILSLNWGDDEVILRESGTGDLIIREYMKKDRPQYYAQVTRSGGTVTIRRGRRPWLPWFWKTARIEIYLPRSFRENLRISHSSGAFSAETDLLDYRTLDLSVSSGSAFFRRLSGGTVSVRLSSGNLEINGIGGASFISLSSGTMRIDELTGTEHRIKTSSGRMRIGRMQGAGSLEISSGGIAVERLEGNASIEIRSGDIQIAELTGTDHRIRSSSGRTVIEKARGRMELHASSGSVTVGDFSGEGNFELSSGSIALDMREITGDLRFKVSSGNITVNLPREFAFNLDAVTDSGSVLVNEDGNEAARVSGNSTVLRPFGPSPVRTIYTRTSSGRVHINRQ
jgi:DUF4097 and DUF4098 domain-containing protein YvlB